MSLSQLLLPALFSASPQAFYLYQRQKTQTYCPFPYQTTRYQTTLCCCRRNRRFRFRSTVSLLSVPASAAIAGVTGIIEMISVSDSTQKRCLDQRFFRGFCFMSNIVSLLIQRKIPVLYGSRGRSDYSNYNIIFYFRLIDFFCQ